MRSRAAGDQEPAVAEHNVEPGSAAGIAQIIEQLVEIAPLVAGNGDDADILVRLLAEHLLAVVRAADQQEQVLAFRG